VRVKRSDYRVRARSGYTAPVPPPVRASLEFAAVDTAQQQIDLARDDLEIIEDGVPQKLEVFHEAVAPVSIMLALDSSGSMKRSAPTVQDAVRAFIGALRPDDPLGLMMFADSPKLVHGFSHDREESLQAVDAYIANGGTALYDALGDGLTQLATREGRRVLIIVSDGRDENATSNGPGSVRHWEEVLTQVRDVDATIYVIGLGSNVDKPRLEQLASLSGGEAYFTTSVSDLEAHYRRILEELRRRYAIAYTSTNGARDGAWRTVEIRVRQPGVRARSRGGYFAPQ
jgi:VWFA-related protein